MIARDGQAGKVEAFAPLELIFQVQGFRAEPGQVLRSALDSRVLQRAQHRVFRVQSSGEQAHHQAGENLAPALFFEQVVGCLFRFERFTFLRGLLVERVSGAVEVRVARAGQVTQVQPGR